MTLRTVLCLIIAIMSLVSLASMGLDKRAARQGARRIPEKRLFLFAALGGALGGLFGMYLFHHKTRHWYFVLGFWALFLLQCALLVYISLFLRGPLPG